MLPVTGNSSKIRITKPATRISTFCQKMFIRTREKWAGSPLIRVRLNPTKILSTTERDIIRQFLSELSVNQIQWQKKNSTVHLEEEKVEKPKPAKPAPKPKEASLHPIRPDKPQCPSWVEYGKCRFGKKCLYNHPPLKTAEDEFEEIMEATAEALLEFERKYQRLVDICDSLLETLKELKSLPKLTLSKQALTTW